MGERLGREKEKKRERERRGGERREERGNERQRGESGYDQKYNRRVRSLEN